MEGLQRRYTLNEILAIKQGMKKIEPLNYDGLRMLRDPLYVKFAQTLKDESTDRQASITADKEFKILLQKIASERNIPLDQLEALLRGLKPKEDTDGGTTRLPDDMDTDDDDDDDFPPSSGGGGGGGSGSGPSGGNPPPSGPSGSNEQPPPMGLRPYMKNFTPGTGGGDGWKTTRKRRNRGPDDEDKDPPPPMASSAAYRANLELEAQLHELRNEMRKQQRHETIIREVVQAPRQENPLREIVREFHQIIYPTPLPQVPSRQDESLINRQLVEALQRAMDRNENLALMAQNVGMTMNQFIEYMKANLRRGVPDMLPETSSSSSSGGPPPPPPAAGAEKSRSPYKPKAKTKAKPAAVTLDEMGVLTKTPEARSRSAARGREPTPIAINTPRAVSVASTVPYDDQDEAQEKLLRSRSKPRMGALPEFSLPIKGVTRGRSPTNKADRIISAIAETQNKALVKGQIRNIVGNFAKRVHEKRLEKRLEARPNKRAATADPTPRKEKSFDEIADLNPGTSSPMSSVASLLKRPPAVGPEIVRRRLK